MLEALSKLTHVGGVVNGPGVLPAAVRLAFFELPLIGVPVCENIHTRSLLQTLFPLAFITVTVFPLMDPIAFSLGVTPLPDVRVAAVGAGPHSISVFESLLPLTVIDLPVAPLIDTFSMGLAVLEGTEIGIIVRIAFEATTVP
jgi:hypothetical protein